MRGTRSRRAVVARNAVPTRTSSRAPIVAARMAAKAAEKAAANAAAANAAAAVKATRAAKSFHEAVRAKSGNKAYNVKNMLTALPKI